MADVGVAEDNSDGADVLSVTISSSDGGWILDTGCSYHMCPNRNSFATYRSFDGGKVLMGNDVACKVVGIGSIQIRMHDGIVRTLTDVRHVPELRKNLISLGTLDSNGCSYRAAGGVMRIMKGALVVMKGLKQNCLYLLQGSTVTGVAATTSSSDIDSDTTKLWHMRLGHMSERDEDDGSHSTKENEEPQEQQYNIARNRSRREIRPPQKFNPSSLSVYQSFKDMRKVKSRDTLRKFKFVIKSFPSASIGTNEVHAAYPKGKLKDYCKLASIDLKPILL
ncbi:hypothetical protein RJ640_021834 [Escallonia rubra]|uniref:GAG-pre-integrase domain-containing protein n=1 Tax=Escallonia rubra TaxID=112253 RepID=A0AA88UIL7_9ASTE|nr:hypothetical protein RJ640_021834 [Escallonia rubra]